MSTFWIGMTFETARKQFPDQLPRINQLYRMLNSITIGGNNQNHLKHFAENMIHLGNNPEYKGIDPYFLKMYELMQSLQKEGILPSTFLNQINNHLVKRCGQYGITTAAQYAALSLGVGLAAVIAGMAIGTVGLNYVAPEGFFEPEDNPLLPEDSEEDLERFRQDKIEYKIRNNIPFCQFNEGLDKCLPTSNSNHDDESKCYVKEGQCKVNKGWIKSAYNWWTGKDTDTPLFYKNQQNTLFPLTAENYHPHQVLYKQDGSLFKDGWECPICLESTDARVVWTRSGKEETDADGRRHDICGHKYHKSCIDQMIDYNLEHRIPLKCTLCRNNIILPHFTERPNPHHEGKKSKKGKKKKRSFRKNRM